MAALTQLLNLLGFIVGQKDIITGLIAQAKARGYQGDTDALLSAADEADRLRVEAESRS